MHVHTGFNVVEQVPTGMVRIVIDDENIAASPTPIDAFNPVPLGYLKNESARKPHTPRARIHANGTMPYGWTDLCEASVLERMCLFEARIVRALVSVPVIVVDVRPAIRFPVL